MRNFVGPQLLNTARAARDAYRRAEPFPHAVFDGLFPDDVVRAVVDAFPGPHDPMWHRYDREHEVKLETQGEDRLPWSISEYLHQLNSAPMLDFLVELTGIEGLLPDPYFFGGGLHQIEPGGLLDVHADFNRHSKLPLFRRLNLITYLNDDWQETYQGHLELWSSSAAIKRIAPVFNRTVIFTISAQALHGHPVPLACPPGRTRRSVAVYYYTVDPPPGEADDVARSTFWLGQKGARPALRIAKDLVPPIAWRASKRLAQVRRQERAKP